MSINGFQAECSLSGGIGTAGEGTLKQRDHVAHVVYDGSIILSEVFEVVNAVNPKTGQRIFRLFRRQTRNWNGPTCIVLRKRTGSLAMANT
jgi:hypothetical protein